MEKEKSNPKINTRSLEISLLTLFKNSIDFLAIIPR